MKTTPLWAYLVRVPATIYWIAKCGLRFVMMRWYIWRDAPEWLLQQISIEFDPSQKWDDNHRAIMQGAIDEWALRKHRRSFKRKV